MGVTPQLFKQEHGLPRHPPDFPNRKRLLELFLRVLPDLNRAEPNRKLKRLLHSLETIESLPLLLEQYARLVAVLLEHAVLRKNMTELLHRSASLLAAAPARSPFHP